MKLTGLKYRKLKFQNNASLPPTRILHWCSRYWWLKTPRAVILHAPQHICTCRCGVVVEVTGRNRSDEPSLCSGVLATSPSGLTPTRLSPCGIGLHYWDHLHSEDLCSPVVRRRRHSGVSLGTVKRRYFPHRATAWQHCGKYLVCLCSSTHWRECDW